MLKAPKFYGILTMSFIFLFLNTVGSHLQKYGNVDWLDRQGSNLIYWSVGNFLVAFFVADILYRFWPAIEYKIKINIAKSEKDKRKVSASAIFMISFFTILVAWIPCALAYYPGIFDYDVLGQIPQGTVVGYSKGHPLLHTIFLNKTYQIGAMIFESGSAGVMLYTIIQMMLLSGCISYAITYLYRQNVNRKICLVFCLWFAIFPTHAIMSVSTTKDVIFSGTMLVFFILVYDVIVQKNKRNFAACILFGVVCALLRNNMVYAIAVFLVSILLMKFVCKKKIAINIWGYVGTYTMVVFFVINMVLSHTLNATSGSKVEMLSVPLQQLARVYNYDQMEIEDQTILFQMVPQEALNNYSPSLADPVKSFVDHGEMSDNRQQYLDLYLKNLSKSPGTYINAFLEMTRGLWHLNDTSHIWTYGSPNYLEYSIRELPEEWKLPPVIRDVKWKSAKQYYDIMSRGELVKDVPLLSWLFAPALYCWILVFMFYYTLSRRNLNLILWLWLALLYGATLLLGPAVLVRYVYFAFLLVPFMGALILNTKEKED